MSASSITTHLAAAVCQPRLRWALRSGPLSRTFAPRDAAIAFVSSVEALSTTMISTSLRKPSNARMQFAMFADSFRVVMTTERVIAQVQPAREQERELSQSASGSSP